MQVTINVTDEVRKLKPKFGRLVALAFENLFRNASQHAGDKPNVEVTISLSGETLEILFEDDGPGINSSISKHLFEKGVSTGPEGKGLGLYLTKTIVESESGTIDWVPSDHSGCCFRVKLPVNGEN
jgi:signal transduction histidine kinase